MYVAIPPKMCVSEFMSYLKGKSTLMLFDRHPEYRTKWGDRHFWARGYFVSTVGNVNEENTNIVAMSFTYGLNHGLWYTVNKAD